MRSAVTLFVAYLLLILQSTVLELAPVHMVTPSLGLLVVLHVGFSSKWTVSSAAVVSFATGYLFDLFRDQIGVVETFLGRPIPSWHMQRETA